MTDSKLAKQAALPRRSPYRSGTIAVTDIPGRATDFVIGIKTPQPPKTAGARYKNGKLQPPKKKRKSQAKAKK